MSKAVVGRIGDMDYEAQAMDPVQFARRSLGLNPDELQARALRSDHKRILFNCCRQWGKSTIASAKVLHRAVFRPNQMILVISRSMRQSGELFRKILVHRRLLDWLPEDLEETKTAIVLHNHSRIVSLPGTEETVVGFSAVDLCVEDEASRVADDLYFAVRPMLAVSNGALMLMSTPRGKRGHFWREWTEGEGWDKYEIKAADCARISAAFLAGERASMLPRWYRQEYECSFEELEDAVFEGDSVDAAFSADVQPLFGEDKWVSSEVEALFSVDDDDFLEDEAGGVGGGDCGGDD
jgi:hypothetical protein